MQPFEDTCWTTSLHEEPYITPDKTTKTVAYYVVSGWEIPFTYESWAIEQGFPASETPEQIYEYCATKLTLPMSKILVKESATRLPIEPGMIEPIDKMASFYLLRLLSSIDYRAVWKEWRKLSIPIALLKDEIFCLCVVALHPVLYGKLHPIGRNYRRVCLEAIAGWKVKSFSLMQFAHPDSMRVFKGRQVDINMIGSQLQSHTEGNYWVFNDSSVVVKVIGKPGARRWFELEFVGPQAVEFILNQRQKHGNSNSALESHLKKNRYYTI